MFSNRQQRSICYLILFAALTLVCVKFIQINLSYPGSVDLSNNGKHGLLSPDIREPFHIPNQLKYSKQVTVTKSYLLKCTAGVVEVPINNIMSGKPLFHAQDDPLIIDYIWEKNHIQPRSVEGYNLKSPNTDPSMGQGQLIRKILKNMKKGFFVECGALDGETRSNTLYMEMNLDWNGLLIEGDPSNFNLMKQKNRNAWMANTCLAINPYPHTATFQQNFNVGKVVGEEEGGDKANKKRNHVTVQCMPLFSLLSALNVTTVDYFSLDVEGSELKVLRTIPFDKVNIRTLSVEFSHTTEGKDQLLEFMLSKGYRKVGEVLNKGGLANDFIFVNKDVQVSDDIS